MNSGSDINQAGLGTKESAPFTTETTFHNIPLGTSWLVHHFRI